MRGANAFTTERARELPNLSSEAEKKLWNRLRARALGGHKFMRHADWSFLRRLRSPRRRLVVEVDGSQHSNNASDTARDKWLVAHRCRVLRFWNNDVLRNTDGVLQPISATLVEAPPHPDR